MKKILLPIVIIILFSSCRKEEIEQPGIADEIVALVNDYRSGKNLSSLQVSQEATNQAQIHTENMASGATAFGHDGFNDRFDILKSRIGARSMGENVAKGQQTADQAMEAWINSDGHRANIEGDFTHIGVGFATDATGTTYFTQIFVKQ